MGPQRHEAEGSRRNDLVDIFGVLVVLRLARNHEFLLEYTGSGVY